MKISYRQVSRGICLKEDKILLVKAANRSNYFLPGGGIEPFESAFSALEREILEELGCNISISHFLGVIDNKWENKDATHYETNYLFSIKLDLDAGKDPISKESCLQFEWKPISHLPSVNILPATIQNTIDYLCSPLPKNILWEPNF